MTKKDLETVKTIAIGYTVVATLLWVLVLILGVDDLALTLVTIAKFSYFYAYLTDRVGGKGLVMWAMVFSVIGF